MERNSRVSIRYYIAPIWQSELGVPFGALGLSHCFFILLEIRDKYSCYCYSIYECHHGLWNNFIPRFLGK